MQSNMDAKMEANARDMRSRNDKMDANTQDLRNKMDESARDMDANMEALMGNMQTQRGEMQTMGLSLQSGQKAITAIARGEMRTMDYKMAAPRGGTSEPWGSVTAVWPAMDTGKVGTSDVIIVGETCRVRHEETTEEPKEVTETEKLTETKSQEETEIIGL